MSENTIEAMPRSDAKTRWPWYVWDIVLLGLYVVLCVAFFCVPSALEYLGTRRDGHSSWGVYGFLAFMWLGLLLFIGPWILALRLFIAWPRHIRGFRRLLLRWAVVIVGVVSLLALFYEFWPSGYQFRLWGFRRYVQRQADIPAIQAWLDTVDPIACNKEPIAIVRDEDGTVRVTPGDVNLPSPVLDLKPRYVRLSLDGTNRPMVCLQWGSGLEGTWGLTVGRKDMPIPKTQWPTTQTLPGGKVFRNRGEDRLPIADGAYIWHELE
ncbi:MAG: hypothetical protein RBR19_17480 [Sedimentisphaerales bacterium]|jgi:hypothetical protein|nr:hypothetical protein [Sedimentisphaerales bacterium]NLT77639.1 hypothetical protein [Planctomycetota bacterium]